MKTVLKVFAALLIFTLFGCAGVAGNYQSTMTDEGMMAPGDVTSSYPPYYHPRR